MNKISYIFLICLCVMACSEGLNSNMPTPEPEAVQPTSIVSGMPFVAFGKMPAALLSQLTTVPTNEWAQTTNANQTVNAQTRYLIINTDYVSDINKFAESPLIVSAEELKIPIMIGSDKHDIKEEAVISILGGTKFQESELTIIERSNTGFSITPVGNREGYLLPEYLSARLTIPEDNQPNALTPEEYLENDTIYSAEDSTSQINPYLKNGRAESALSCKGVRKDDDLRYNGIYDKSVVRTMPIYNGQFCTKYDFKGYANADGLSGFTRMKQWIASSANLETLQDRTSIISGQGQITFRSTNVRTSETSKKKYNDFRVSSTVSTGFGLVEASVTGFYSKNKGESITYGTTYGVGYTTYSQSCFYACCSYMAGYKLSQDKIGTKGRLYGSTLAYYKSPKYPFLSMLKVKYVYTKNKSMLRMHYYTYSKPYIRLVFDKINPKCNDMTCKARATCKNDVLPK